MKNKNKSKYKRYYLFGGLLMTISFLGMIFGLTFGYVVPEYKYAGWIGVAIVGLFLLLNFYSIYLLKKGNFVKFNTKNNQDTQDFEEQVKEKYKE